MTAAAREHRKKMKFKSHRHLWRGVNSVVVGAGPAHALHFATYEFCKDLFGAGGNHLLASGAAGACATLAHDSLLNPFDGMPGYSKMQCRLKTSHPNHFFSYSRQTKFSYRTLLTRMYETVLEDYCRLKKV